MPTSQTTNPTGTSDKPAGRSAGGKGTGAHKKSRAVAFLWGLVRIVVVVILIFGIWKLVTVVFQVQDFILPAPEDVLVGMYESAGSLLNHTLTTLGEVALGFVIAAILGLAVSVMMTASDRVARVIYPVLVASQTVPKVAIAPLLVVWFGFGSGPIIIIVVIMSFFPITISSAVGLREVPRDLIMLGHSMGFTGLRLFRKIMFPYALGSVFAGMKVGMTLALIGSIVGEFVSGQSGLGYYILASSSAFNVALTFGGIIAVVILGLALFKGVEIAERLMMPWRDEQSPLMAKKKARNKTRLVKS